MRGVEEQNFKEYEAVQKLADAGNRSILESLDSNLERSRQSRDISDKSDKGPVVSFVDEGPRSSPLGQLEASSNLLGVSRRPDISSVILHSQPLRCHINGKPRFSTCSRDDSYK